MFTARYGLSPSIKQIRFVLKGLNLLFILCIVDNQFKTQQQNQYRTLDIYINISTENYCPFGWLNVAN